MNEADTRSRNESAQTARFLYEKQQLAQNSLDYALETILKEAKTVPAQSVSAQKKPLSDREERENSLSDFIRQQEGHQQNEQFDITAGNPPTKESESAENKLDAALDSLLKDAEIKAQNARVDGVLSRSPGLDPAAKKRQALQAAAKRRLALKEGKGTDGAEQAEKKPFYERIDPKIARILMLLPFIFVVCFFLYCIFVWPVKASVTIEAGTAIPDVSEYAWFSWQNIRYATSDEVATYLKSHSDLSDQIDTTLPGRYAVFIRFGFITYERSLLVADTTPPVIEGDTEKTAFIGIPFSYRQGIRVTDNSSAPVTLNINADAVDLQTAGDYTVVYTATDSTGNITGTEGVIHVVVAPTLPKSAEEEEVQKLAEDVLNEIITPNMTYEEKAHAVYDWVQKMITFRETNQGKVHVTANALQALRTHSGDCHVFAAVSEVLLTCAGIPNMRIENVAGGNVHEWNLINLGAGWHHFDTVIAQGVPAGRLFNLTSAELDEEATKKGFVHQFDLSLYPKIE